MSTEPTLKTFVSPKFINMGTGPTLKTFVILCLAVSCVIFKDVEGVRKKGLPPGLAKKVNNESPVPAQGNFGDLEGSLKNIENQLLDIVDDLPVQNKKSALYNPNARAGERFQSCLTPGGQRGSCTYLRQCPLPEIVISFTAFLEYMCFIQNTYVGVCCPNYYELSGPQSTPRPQPVTTPSSNKPISAVCGRNYDTRIVGGTAADPKDWIWMASVVYCNY
ncbi:serine protease ea-like [Tachypleus tridentatus]|uniref:serine protease ea-like n=1 Tax=Tachypleus tridentatus TaxID=6853 RepID=UPI003FCEF2C5